MTSPAARLLGFILLLVILFAGAFAVGAGLGPVTLTHAPSMPGGGAHMGSSGHTAVLVRQLAGRPL